MKGREGERKEPGGGGGGGGGVFFFKKTYREAWFVFVNESVKIWDRETI